MSRFLVDRLRQEAKQINTFGGFDEVQQLLEEAAQRIDELEYRRLQTNVILGQLRDMHRDLGATMNKTADLVGNTVEAII
jgi:hypothetical protein